MQVRSVGQAVKTPPSHGGNTGSIPVRTAKFPYVSVWICSGECSISKVFGDFGYPHFFRTNQAKKVEPIKQPIRIL